MPDGLIVVAGLPSGGTSLVAGVLHHLGVDMGDVPPPEAAIGTRRGYRGFECDVAKGLFGNMYQAPSIVRRGLDTYARLRLETEPGPSGVKMNILMLVGLDPNCASLPIRVVEVRRDLADTFESDIRHYGECPIRASLRGQLHFGLRQLLRAVPPVCTVEYENAVREPFETAAGLDAVLDLGATLGKVARAAEFIDPVTKGVLVA